MFLKSETDVINDRDGSAGGGGWKGGGAGAKAGRSSPPSFSFARNVIYEKKSKKRVEVRRRGRGGDLTQPQREKRRFFTGTWRLHDGESWRAMARKNPKEGGKDEKGKGGLGGSEVESSGG